MLLLATEALTGPEARRWAARAAGAWAGLAMSVKYPGVAVTGLVLTLLPGERVTALVPMLVLGTPFYLRNLLTRGNPVFPLAYGAFGGLGAAARFGSGMAGRRAPRPAERWVLAGLDARVHAGLCHLLINERFFLTADSADWQTPGRTARLRAQWTSWLAAGHVREVQRWGAVALYEVRP